MKSHYKFLSLNTLIFFLAPVSILCFSDLEHRDAAGRKITILTWRPQRDILRIWKSVHLPILNF